MALVFMLGHAVVLTATLPFASELYACALIMVGSRPRDSGLSGKEMRRDQGLILAPVVRH